MCKKKWLIGFVFLLMVSTSCQGSTFSKPLNGSGWSLSQLNSHSLVPASHIELQFDAERFSGFGGCNSYGGKYQADGEKFSASEGVESTAMACLTPEGVGEQESEYFLALREATRYQVNGNRLEMLNQSQELILVFFLNQPGTKAEMASLVGTAWQVETVEGNSLIAGSQITMRFSMPGIVEGFAGCRNYQAEFTEDDQGTRFTRIRMAEEECNQEDLLLQEQNFTDYFTWADHFEVVGENLVLFTQRDEVIVLIPVQE